MLDATATRAVGTPASERTLRTRGRATMAKLLDAGREVVAEQGYQAARIDDIVKLADLSHGTFYLYFTDKEDLVRALAEECMGEIVVLATSLGPVGPGIAGRRELRAWLERFLEAYRRWGAVIRVFMEERSVDRRLLRLGFGAFGQIAESLVVRIDEAGAIEGSADLAAVSLLAMVERYAYMVISRGLPVEEEVVLDTLTRLVHRGYFGGR